MRKNIQVIDGADNCTYDIYAVSDDDFKTIFCGPKQDVEFIEDFIARVGAERAKDILDRLWNCRIEKKTVDGIHGTLFCELEMKRPFYPTKSEAEMSLGL